MKKILFLSVLNSILTLGFSQTVNVHTAMDYAARFLSQKQTQKSTRELKLYYTDVEFRQKSGNPATAFYVFNREDGGFVMVAADRRCKAVLAYSTTSTFDTTGMPENLRAWLQGYREEIGKTIAADTARLLQTHPDWTAAVQTDEIVAPLIQTHWTQSDPYNALCPLDIASQTHCPSGCVATAMAQVMNYWKYPIKGKDKHAYVHPVYGTLSADFAQTTYDWGNMANAYSSNSSKKAKDAVSTLMYHCGISLQMNYAPRGSDANTYFNVPGFVDARSALMEHFGYDTAIGKIRDNYAPAYWVTLLKEELDNGRPMMYRGTGYGGHSFVCDGYDNRDNFHFNWGWGGSCDGYYSLSVMNPSNYDFSQFQTAVFIQPHKDTTDYVLKMGKILATSHDTAGIDSVIRFSTTVQNIGASDYRGAFAIGLFTLNGEWAGCLSERHHQELLCGDSLQLDFQWKNINEFQPGMYMIRLCYLHSKRWTQLKDEEVNCARLLILGMAEEKRLQLLEDIRMLNNDTLTAKDTLKLRYRVGGGKKPGIVSYIVHIPYLIGDEYDYEYIGEHILSHPEDETQIISIPIARMSGKICGRYSLSCLIADRATGQKVVSNGHSDTCSFFYQGEVADLRVCGGLITNPSPVRIDRTFEIRVPVSNRGNIPYTLQTYAGIYDTNFQLLAYAGPVTKCKLSPGENDTLCFNTLNKKKILKAGQSYYACLLYNSANSSTDQMVKADKGLRNLLKFTVVSGDYGTDEWKEEQPHPYPNPTTDQLRIHLPHSAEIQIFNMEGKRIYRADFPEGKTVIDFSSYPKGSYIIRILASDKSQRIFQIIAQ